MESIFTLSYRAVYLVPSVQILLREQFCTKIRVSRPQYSYLLSSFVHRGGVERGTVYHSSPLVIVPLLLLSYRPLFSKEKLERSGGVAAANDALRATESR